jgi:formimidoylglutamate deiminase
MLSSHVFASHRTSALHSTWVAGRQIVESGRHPLHAATAQGFLAARSAIISAH